MYSIIIGRLANVFLSDAIGALLTTVVLAFGLVSFHRGNAKMSQNMMRLRVVAQGSTVLALCGGVYLGCKSYK